MAKKDQVVETTFTDEEAKKEEKKRLLERVCWKDKAKAIWNHPVTRVIKGGALIAGGYLLRGLFETDASSDNEEGTTYLSDGNN